MRRVFGAILVFVVVTYAPQGGAQKVRPETATFILQKDYDRGFDFGSGTRQLYFVINNRSCKSKKKIAAFSWVTGNEKAVEVAAGKPIMIWAFTEHFDRKYRAVCQSAFTFTPKAGSKYTMALKTFVDTECQVVVRDIQSEVAPPDIAYEHFWCKG